MNIDDLFDQIEMLDREQKQEASYAISLIHSAMVRDFLSATPMESQFIYKRAYETLQSLGLEVGGLIKPHD